MVEEKVVEITPAEQIEADNKRLEAAIKTRELLLARQMISGKANAGESPPPVDQEKLKIENINKWLKSTGMHI
ncbi:MAG: hypothetical protein PHV93_04735 [Candidatus Pacebacteria bacterium]|nr:hypothetical protein [Candidatus Paceibacterota bacterium]